MTDRTDWRNGQSWMSIASIPRNTLPNDNRHAQTRGQDSYTTDQPDPAIDSWAQSNPSMSFTELSTKYRCEPGS